MNYLQIIKENNPKSLPVITINNSWVEGSNAKYNVDGFHGSIKTYEKFLSIVRKMYKGVNVIFVQTGGFMNYETTLTEGEIAC